ncbi:ribose ABC transporter ATP-binding protein RbsA [Fusibacter sp. JL216-2]|uniref:ribose ABC transporter ATP-binding protein RbsA n=1 Tax=Fusibacter sp. JL216-2 TaxID=3071453 RepID=UPI003D356CCA
MREKILEMKHVTKTFPGVKALDDVHLNVYQGQVMALLGENGAGKSTLMKILSGVYRKSEGTIRFKGQDVEMKGPKDAQDLGIAIIHQELNLIEEMSIGENIFLGREPKKFLNVMDWQALMKKSEDLLTSLNIKVDPRKSVKNFSIGNKQMFEIAKALSLDAELIIMDEPTDALTDQETESLFEVIRALKAEGKSIVYISHRLKEIFEICDDVTVLRDGQFIAEKSVSEINEDMLIELMVGRKLEDQYPYLNSDSGDVVLKVHELKNAHVRNISFELKKGEILGVAGLMGAGRTELAKTLFGHFKMDSGSVELDGQPLTIKSEKQAIESGITYVSEDRKKDGLVLGMSVKENMSMSALKRLSKSGLINQSLEKKMADDFVGHLSIKTPSLNQKIKFLSGGNQQKVSISKSLMTDPKVLILDEPTRGVDVGAKKEIYDLMNEFKEKGMAILMISSEIPELLGMCDRIMVMHEGTISGIIHRSTANQEGIMRLAVGLRRE